MIRKVINILSTHEFFDVRFILHVFKVMIQLQIKAMMRQDAQTATNARTDEHTYMPTPTVIPWQPGRKSTSSGVSLSGTLERGQHGKRGQLGGGGGQGRGGVL